MGRDEIDELPLYPVQRHGKRLTAARTLELFAGQAATASSESASSSRPFSVTARHYKSSCSTCSP